MHSFSSVLACFHTVGEETGIVISNCRVQPSSASVLWINLSRYRRYLQSKGNPRQ